MNIPMLVTLIILFIVAIFRNIDWRARAVKWVGNNPANSQHYIEAGDTIHTVEGKRVLMAAEGQSYVYRDLDKEIYIIDIPPEYPYKYIRGRRIIGQSDGQLVSNPLGYFRPKQIALINEGLTEISELAHGDLLIRAIKSVASNKAKSMLMWLLITAAVAGAYMYYRSQNQTETPVSANVTQNITISDNGTGLRLDNGQTIIIPPGKVIP